MGFVEVGFVGVVMVFGRGVVVLEGLYRRMERSEEPVRM